MNRRFVACAMLVLIVAMSATALAGCSQKEEKVRLHIYLCNYYLGHSINVTFHAYGEKEITATVAPQEHVTYDMKVNTGAFKFYIMVKESNITTLNNTYYFDKEKWMVVNFFDPVDGGHDLTPDSIDIGLRDSEPTFDSRTLYVYIHNQGSEDVNVTLDIVFRGPLDDLSAQRDYHIGSGARANDTVDNANGGACWSYNLTVYVDGLALVGGPHMWVDTATISEQVVKNEITITLKDDGCSIETEKIGVDDDE